MSRFQHIPPFVLYSLLFAAPMLSTACGDKESDEAQGEETPLPEGALSREGDATLEAWATCAIDGYATLATQARALEDAAQAHCDSQSAGTLNALEDSYDATRRQWLELRTFAFGPEIEFPDRWGPKIEIRPPRYEDIEAHFQKHDSFPDPSTTGAHLRGLPAIEYLIYGPHRESLTPEDKACNYLTLLAEDLVFNTANLAQAWAPEGGNFAGDLLAEEGTFTFDTRHDALSGLVNRMGYVAENLRDQDLRDPLGEEQGGPQLDKVVSLQSNRSLDDFRDTIEGVKKLYYGTSDGPGLSAYAASEGLEFDEEFDAAIDAIEDRITALEPSFSDALENNPDAVTQLNRAVEQLQVLFQIDIIGRLELSQIFNDADGD